MKLVGLAVPNIWLIFGHDVKRLGDLDLSTGACPLIHPNYFSVYLGLGLGLGLGLSQ